MCTPILKCVSNTYVFCFLLLGHAYEEAKKRPTSLVKDRAERVSVLGQPVACLNYSRSIATLIEYSLLRLYLVVEKKVLN